MLAAAGRGVKRKTGQMVRVMNGAPSHPAGVGRYTVDEPMRTTPLVAPLAAALLAAGCGSGLSDGLGELSVTRTVEPASAADVRLAQARVMIAARSLSGTATLTLRRLPDAPAEIIGPLFELEVQGASLSQSPVIEIAVSGTARVPAAALVIAHRVTDGSTAHWIPLTSNREYDPRARTVRGDLTVPLAGRPLRFGTLAWCGRDGARVDCPAAQSCLGGACQ